MPVIVLFEMIHGYERSARRERNKSALRVPGLAREDWAA